MKMFLRILDKTVHAIGFSGFRDFLVPEEKGISSTTKDSSELTRSKNAQSSDKSKVMGRSLNGRQKLDKNHVIEGDTLPGAIITNESVTGATECEENIETTNSNANESNAESETAPIISMVDDEKENDKPSTSHNIPHDCSSPVRNSKPLTILDNMPSPFKIPHSVRKIARSTPKKRHETTKHDDSESEDDGTLPEVDNMNVTDDQELPKIQPIKAKKDGKEILDAVFLNLKGKDGAEERVPKISAKKNGLL